MSAVRAGEGVATPAARRILVTGAAGFIGAAVCQRLLARGDRVLGYDNLNAYYEVTLKQARLARLASLPGFAFRRAALEDHAGLDAAFAEFRPQRVVHLAAQAGVGHALEDPRSYASSNLLGFLNVLEACRAHPVEHLVYASSSSVYGGNARLPYAATDRTDHPLSLYAATKKSNELMAHAYSHLFRIPVSGLRFFTVYGPWGRPDMALFRFTRGILSGEPIDIHNHGRHSRDFTYIDDIVEGVLRVLDRPAAPDPDFDAANPEPSHSNAPFRVYNIGNQQPVALMRYVEVLEQALQRKARIRFLPAQPGDVPATLSDSGPLQRDTGYAPATSVETGVRRFVDWFCEYYGVRAADAQTTSDERAARAPPGVGGTTEQAPVHAA